MKIAAAALAAVSAATVSAGVFLILPAAGVVAAGMFGLAGAWLVAYLAVSR